MADEMEQLRTENLRLITSLNNLCATTYSLNETLKNLVNANEKLHRILEGKI